MSNDHAKPTRTWQEIAALAAQEKDSQRLIELIAELDRALEERDRKLKADPPAQGKNQHRSGCV